MSEIPRDADGAADNAAPPALMVLRRAHAAMGVSASAHEASPRIDQIMQSAREIYASACTPANTRLISEVVKRILQDPAARMDPEIWAFFANVRCCDYLNRWNGANTVELAAAEHAVATALHLDPNHRRAVYVSAFIHRARGRHAESLAAFERVIALKPDAGDRMLAEAYAQSGEQWMYLGHPERTGILVDKAIDIVPPDSPAIGVFSWIAARPPLIKGDYREAIERLERSVAIRRNFWYTRAWLIAAYALNGQHEAARQALGEFREMFPQFDSVAAIIAAERNIPHANPLLIDARDKVHEALVSAGLPAEQPG
ncbi:MAG: tetratricopeptide repeat protein [Stellaceae bacterium]